MFLFLSHFDQSRCREAKREADGRNAPERHVVDCCAGETAPGIGEGEEFGGWFLFLRDGGGGDFGHLVGENETYEGETKSQ